MERPDFENLQVYQLAEKLGDEIWQIVGEWNEFDKNTIGKEIVLAADTIGANIAAGRGRYNLHDNRDLVRIARCSLDETRHWLRRAYTRHLLTSEQVKKLKPIIDDLSPKLNAYLKYLDNAVKQQGNNDE